MKSPISEFELVDLLRRNENRGYRILYECYKKTLITSIIQKHFEFDTNTWDDIISDVFINVYRNIKTYNDNYSLFTWLKAITFNVCRNTRANKNYKKKALTSNYDDCYDFYEQISIDNVMNFNSDFLNEYKFLKPISLEIIKKNFVDGFELKEIAAEMDMTKEQIYYLKLKALARIKRYYEKTKRNSRMVGR